MGCGYIISTEQMEDSDASLLDPKGNFTIGMDNWVVGVFHYKKNSKGASDVLDGSDHVFLIVEGMLGNGRLYFIRHDFCIDKNESNKFNISSKEESTYPDKAMAYRSLINNFFEGKEVVGMCWQIDAEDAAEIHHKVEKINNDPNNIYEILGGVFYLSNSIISAVHESDIENISGQVTNKYLENSIKMAKEFKEAISLLYNPFNFFRVLLRSLGTPEITDSLPKTPNEIIEAVPNPKIKLPSHNMVMAAELRLEKVGIKGIYEKICDKLESKNWLFSTGIENKLKKIESVLIKHGYSITDDEGIRDLMDSLNEHRENYLTKFWSCCTRDKLTASCEEFLKALQTANIATLEVDTTSSSTLYLKFNKTSLNKRVELNIDAELARRAGFEISITQRVNENHTTSLPNHPSV